MAQCGIFDDPKTFNNLIIKIKQNMGIDFKNYTLQGWFAGKLNCALRQHRKKFNQKLKKICGIIANKTFESNMLPGKTCTKKRAKGIFYEEHAHFPDGNASRSLHNKFRNKNNRPDLMVEMQKIDVSKKKKPDWKNL